MRRSWIGSRRSAPAPAATGPLWQLVERRPGRGDLEGLAGDAAAGLTQSFTAGPAAAAVLVHPWQVPDEQAPELSGSQERRRRGRVTVAPRTTARMDGGGKRTEDERLLTRSSRPAFISEDPWRVLRIQAEFVDGFDALA